LSFHDRNEGFKEGDINEWLQLIFSSHWDNWIAYNDQSDQPVSHKAHAKGILVWNESRFGWLIHSVPHFPTTFDGKNISSINKSELLYGQSFLYTERSFECVTLDQLFQQLCIMDIHVIHSSTNQFHQKRETYKKHNNIHHLQVLIFDTTMIHIAKSPDHLIDIYSHYLIPQYKHKWLIQTWKRGHAIQDPCRYIEDVSSMKWGSETFLSSQDHSKLAVSEKGYVWVGDLNRMTSQYQRGGGGIVFQHDKLAQAIRTWFQ
jgi:deoxyribonuclease-2